MNLTEYLLEHSLDDLNPKEWKCTREKYKDLGINFIKSSKSKNILGEKLFIIGFLNGKISRRFHPTWFELK